MPAVATQASVYGYGRPPTLAATPASIPTYYTSSSGFLMNQPGYTATTLQIKSTSAISTAGAIRTYTGLTAAWTFIHDKDLDNNTWYGMDEGGRVLRKYVLAKGGTTVTVTSLYTLSAATTSVLGACYAPACMWTGTSYGAFIIGGSSQAVIHVLEFNSTKTNIATRYTVAYTSEVYGTEIIPKQASGFSQHFGVAYTRGSKQMSSWTVNMDTRTWSNRTDNSYTGGTNGPFNGDGMIYYPPGKPIFLNDPNTSTNRLAMNDTSSARLYVWTVTQSGNALVWTFLKQVPTSENGAYPYHMSLSTYNAVI